MLLASDPWYQWLPTWIAALAGPAALLALWAAWRQFLRSGFVHDDRATIDNQSYGIRVSISNVGRLVGIVESIKLINKRRSQEATGVKMLEAGDGESLKNQELESGRSCHVTLVTSSGKPFKDLSWWKRLTQWRVRVRTGDGRFHDIRIKKTRKIDRWTKAASGVFALAQSPAMVTEPSTLDQEEGAQLRILRYREAGILTNDEWQAARDRIGYPGSPE
jgi:hypothetical protein